MKLRSLSAEIRRRRVHRVVVIYAVVGWLVVQVAATTFPLLQLPAWTPTLVLGLTLVGFPLALVLGWAYDLTPEGVVRTGPVDAVGPALLEPVLAGSVVASAELSTPPSPSPQPHIRAPLAGPERSIAVLPFVNMSTDPEQEYFSDGIAEELLNVLAQIPELRVAARTSAFTFRGRQATVQEIAATLKVAHLLEGSVRRSGSRIRITAQLIETEGGYHLWSEVYDREMADVFAVQDEIAREIGSVLRCRLTGQMVAGELRCTTVPDAHNLYLKARFNFNRVSPDALQSAIGLYREALDLDPGYALAHAGIAEVYCFLANSALPPREAYPPAIEHIQRALALDATLPEAHALAGLVALTYEWNPEKAAASLSRALELNPSNANARFYEALHRCTIGDLASGIEGLRAAATLDPLSPIISFYTEALLLFAGDPAASLEQHRLTEQVAPGFFVQEPFEGYALLALGRAEEAEVAFRAAGAGLGRPAAGLAVVLAVTGRTAEAESVLTELEQRFEAGQYLSPEFIAQAHLALGDVDAAFGWLERSVDVRSSNVPIQAVWPAFAALRADPRHARLRARVEAETI